MDLISRINSRTRFQLPRRLALGLFCVTLFWLETASAQRLLTSFGPCIERALNYTPAGLVVSVPPTKARAVIAVLALEQPDIHFYAVSDSGTLVNTGSFRLAAPQRLLLSYDFNPERGPEYISLASDASSVSVLKRRAGKLEEKSYPLTTRPQRFAVADINNDGYKDILLFGKSSAGVTTLMGRPDGTFVTGPVLFPEISVSDLKTTDLNGDGITDVLLLNWLSNQLVVFYGISRGIFSEQLTVNLPAEPADLAISPVTRQRTMRVAVTIPNERHIALFTGDAIGEFTPDGTIDCPGKPLGVQFANINADLLPDIISSTERGILVSLATSKTDFGPLTTFGAESAPGLWVVADADGDQRNDLLFLERAAKRLVVAGNTEHTARVAWPDEYAVGNLPHGLTLHDMNGDGRIDIVVANTGSSTLSYLMNQGNGKMLGQQSLSLPERPVFVRTVSAPTAAIHTLVTSHPAADKITVITLADEFARSTLFAMPAGTNPYVLKAKEDSVTRNLEILVRSSNRKDGSVSLSLFEQMSKRQFLERSIRANLPNKISALSVDDFFGNQTYELAFATNDKLSKQTTISLASASGGFEFKNVSILFSYPDSLASIRSILPASISNSNFRDLLVILGSPVNALGMAFGLGNGVFRDSLVWIPDLQPLDDDAILFQDVDGDGIVDIILIDTMRNAVVVLYGKGGGMFTPPSVICPAGGVTALGVAPMRKPNAHDLILSHSEKGTISIMFAPFRQ